MEETGTVVEVKGQLAMVSTQAKRACHSCSARGVCHLGGDTTMMAEVDNPLGAKVGHVVVIRLKSRTILGAAVLLYGLPLMVFLVGIALGQMLTHHQLGSVAIGLACLAGAYAVVWRVDRRLRVSGKIRPEIVQIVSGDSAAAHPA
jgi:sigma-E factor negative regulatory protein RseC